MLVESLIVLSVLIGILALMTFMHRLALADIEALQRARSEAWRQAVAGCPTSGFSFRDMLSELARGELPLPDTFIPTHFSTASSGTQVTDSDRSANVSRTVRIPCNSEPPASEESSGDWVFEIIGG